MVPRVCRSTVLMPLEKALVLEFRRRFTGAPLYRHNRMATYHGHMFKCACRARSTAHKLTKPCNPQTNGQTERTGRAVKDAAVQTFHFDTLAGRLCHIARPRVAWAAPTTPEPDRG